MGLPAGQLVRVVIGGPVSSQDNWSIGLWATPSPGTLSQADLDGIAANALSSFNTAVWTATTNPWKRQCAAGTKLQSSKVYHYGNGILVGQSQASIAAVAGTGSAPHPSYTAAVMSLHTNVFGRRARGRSYLPFTGGSIDASTGLMTVLQQDATNFAAWLTAGGTGGWSASSSVSLPTVVVSQVGSGAANLVSSVSLNDVPDTQRGRISKDIAVNNWVHTV